MRFRAGISCTDERQHEKTLHKLACCVTFSMPIKSIQIAEHTCTHRNCYNCRYMKHPPPSHSLILPTHCVLLLEDLNRCHLLECPGAILCLVVTVAAKGRLESCDEPKYDCALLLEELKTLLMFTCSGLFSV
jgi:hypothetical protein